MGDSENLYEGVSAAEASVEFEKEGYNDWFLPSSQELVKIYNTVGGGSYLGNLGGWVTEYYSSYWSSSVLAHHRHIHAKSVHFNDDWLSPIHSASRDRDKFVLPIRAFGNWTMGCIDSLACNYNPEANMSDASCEYRELGYDCDGNIAEYVLGMETEGGIVFYLDETGQMGLVAAKEDLGEFEWGCSGVDITGNNNNVSPEIETIGSGYQNTLAIVAGCSDTEDGLYPLMRTDIIIRSENKVTVIDTKYYDSMFQYHYKGNPDKPKFKSANIYQLYTYILNLKEDKEVEGMLLYPDTNSKIRNERRVSGMRIMINNINLNQEWNKIESDMLELLE